MISLDFSTNNHPSLSDSAEYAQNIREFLEQWHNDNEFIEQTTSGSTGAPKTIRIRKEQMLASAEATIQHFNIPAEANCVSLLPTKYIGGKMMLVRAIVGKWQLDVLEPKLNALERIHKNYHFASMIPAQLAEGLEHTDKIDTILLGGAPVSEALENKVKLLKSSVYLGFGMTETVSHVATRKLGYDQLYSAVEPNRFWMTSDDCLVIKAPHLGIEKLETNDIIDLEDTKHFKWLGRKDHVINSGGKKLIIEIMENKLKDLLDLPYYIAKKADDTFGEVPVLHIESAPLDQRTEALLLSEILHELDKHAAPKSIVYHEAFTYTPNGKLIREN